MTEEKEDLDLEIKKTMKALDILRESKQKELDKIFFKKGISFIYECLNLREDSNLNIFLEWGFFALSIISNRAKFYYHDNGCHKDDVFELIINKIVKIKYPGLYLSSSLEGKPFSSLEEKKIIMSNPYNHYGSEYTFLEFLNEFEAQIIYLYTSEQSQQCRD